MTAQQVAQDHRADRVRLAAATDAHAAGLWRDLDPARLDGWSRSLPEVVAVVTTGQLGAAVRADAYLDAVLAAQGLNRASAGRVQPGALAGVASDGRDLLTLLAQPVITAKIATQAGATAEQSMAAGLATLLMIVHTQVADTGRAADQVALTTRTGATGYVRMTVGTTCARCAILAGRWYGWSAGFDRHPRCDCVHVPSREALAGDLRLDPRRLIDAGRVTGLSTRDMEAIELGADPAQVVNAQRGMTTAADRRVTTEGTTRSGLAGQRLRGQPRLMPEQILRDAPDRAAAIRLLRQHGYIL